MNLLREHGVQLSFSDPFVPTLSAQAWHGRQELHSRPMNAETLADVDCVAILTDHTAVDYEALAAMAPVVVDTRNAVTRSHSHVFTLGSPRRVQHADSVAAADTVPVMV